MRKTEGLPGPWIGVRGFRALVAGLLLPQILCSGPCYADGALDTMMQQMAAKKQVMAGLSYDDFSDRDLDFMGARCNYRTHMQGYVEVSLPVPMERVVDGTPVTVRVELHPTAPQVYGPADAVDECPATLPRQRFTGSGVVHGGSISAVSLVSAGGAYRAHLDASLPGSGGQYVLAHVLLTDLRLGAGPLDMAFILSKHSVGRTVPSGWDP